MSHADVNAHSFNQQARTYDDKPYMVNLAGQAAALLQQKLPIGSGTAVLEFGCGTGLLSERLAPVVGSVHGTDIAANMVDVYNEKAQKNGFKNMKAVCVDVLNALERDQLIDRGDLPRKYNVILINMTAHHLDDVLAVLRVLGGLLVGGGRLVLTDLLATERSKRFHGKVAHHNVSHRGGFSEALVREMMSSAGLTLDIFDSSSLRIIKQIEQEDGSQTPEDFEVFMAIAGKE